MSEVIQYRTNCSSQSIFLSHHTNVSDLSSFVALYNPIAENNATIIPKVSLIYVMDINSQRSINSKKSCLNVAMTDIIIS